MSKILTLILAVSLMFGLTGCFNGGGGNRAPYIPTVNLPSEANVNEEVKVTVRSVDPDRNELTYRVRFGDGIEAWSEYRPSGQEVTFSHRYGEQGDYGVTVRAFDRKATSEWSEEKWIKIKTSLPPRLIAILGTCLDSCQHMWKEIGEEHYKQLSFYGNRYGWPGHDLVEELGMKMFINIRAENWRFSPEEQGELSELRQYVKNGLVKVKASGDTRLLGTSQYQDNYKRYRELILKSVPNEDEIRRCVEEWKDRPGCGGYWTDGLGHEPDICGAFIEERKLFYDTVRKYDPDTQNHPVMEMMNMTEFDDQDENWPYPGWKGAFREDTNDLVLVDCYPGTTDIEGNIRWAWKKFVKKYCKKNQVIIQMQAFNYEPGMIWTQYNLWKELMASDEWDNPYKSPMGMCWYKDEAIRQSPEMQQEIKEVIAHAMEQKK